MLLSIYSKVSYFLAVATTVLLTGCYNSQPSYPTEAQLLDHQVMADYNNIFFHANSYIVQSLMKSKEPNEQGFAMYDLSQRRLISANVIVLNKQLDIDTVLSTRLKDTILFIPELQGPYSNVRPKKGEFRVEEAYLGTTANKKYAKVFFIQNIYHKKGMTYISEAYFASRTSAASSSSSCR